METASRPRLHVDVDGTGPAVVLAHGFGGSARNFGPQARALKDRFRVIRYDARGHARSEAPDDPTAYTSDLVVDDLRRVLDETTTERAVVGGLSLGAATALRFALAHPDRTRALVLAAYPAGRDARDGFTAIAEPSPTPSNATAWKRRGRRSSGDRCPVSTTARPDSYGRDSSSTRRTAWSARCAVSSRRLRPSGGWLPRSGHSTSPLW